MLDIKQIRENASEIEARLRTRDASIALAPLVELDERRRLLIAQVEELKSERNAGSQEVGRRKKAGQDTVELLDHLSQLSGQIGNLDEQLRAVEESIDDVVSGLPNLPHPSVPVGPKDAKVVLSEVGDPPDLDRTVRHHLDIGQERGWLDFTRAASIAGSRFPMYVGSAAVLEMALIQFMFSHHARNGYTAVLPPFVANEESFYVSSQLPKFADDIYRIEKDGLYLNPTAESLLVNLHRGEILEEADLPKRYVAYTPCFRREAGSYGEEERGLIRVHQFNKIELFYFTEPESSYETLKTLIHDAEGILQALEIPYRSVMLPTQDLAQQSCMTVDLEVYLPGQGRYYEVSSCSNCEAYQARRGSIRYRPTGGGKPRFVHTLNGSGVATSRLMAAILENNQTEDGRVRVPHVLESAVGGEWL